MEIFTAIFVNKQSDAACIRWEIRDDRRMGSPELLAEEGHRTLTSPDASSVFTVIIGKHSRVYILRILLTTSTAAYAFNTPIIYSGQGVKNPEPIQRSRNLQKNIQS